MLKRMLRTRVKGDGIKAAPSPDTEPKFYKMPPCLELDSEKLLTKKASLTSGSTEIKKVSHQLPDSFPNYETDDLSQIFGMEAASSSLTNSSFPLDLEPIPLHALQQQPLLPMLDTTWQSEYPMLEPANQPTVHRSLDPVILQMLKNGAHMFH